MLPNVFLAGTVQGLIGTDMATDPLAEPVDLGGRLVIVTDFWQLLGGDCFGLERPIPRPLDGGVERGVGLSLQQQSEHLIRSVFPGDYAPRKVRVWRREVLVERALLPRCE